MKHESLYCDCGTALSGVLVLHGAVVLARLLDREISRLCEEISLIPLAESSGFRAKQGRERIGRCPFHDDAGTSLVITAEHRWLCSGFGTCGDVIEWVVKRNDVSRHHAVQEGLPEALVAPEPVKTSTVRRLSSAVSAQADDQDLLEQVVGFYTRA